MPAAFHAKQKTQVTTMSEQFAKSRFHGLAISCGVFCLGLTAPPPCRAQSVQHGRELQALIEAHKSEKANLEDIAAHLRTDLACATRMAEIFKVHATSRPSKESPGVSTNATGNHTLDTVKWMLY